MLDVKTILPQKDRVVVRLLNLEEVYEDLVLQHQSDEERIAVRYGEVIALGPEADQPSHCPGLEVGDQVVFTQFAGAYLPTDDTESLYKLVRGYDIIGMKKEKDKGDDSKWIPTADRILVKNHQMYKESDQEIQNRAQEQR
jgi:co-chaperonin GroES (HSP10)